MINSQIKLISNFLKKINWIRNNHQGNGINAILTYHGVTSKPVKNCVPLLVFQKHLDFLQEEFKLVKLSQYVDSLEMEERTGKDTIVITFDDGYRNNLKYAYPELKKRNIPATIFIPAKNINGYNYWDHDTRKNFPYLQIMSQDEIKSMDKQIIEFGSHGASHKRLSVLSDKELRDEIVGSKQALEKTLDRSIQFFSYPYGRLADFTQKTIDLTSEAGYKAALTCHFGRFNSATDLHCLRRITVWDDDSVEDLRTKLTGFYDWLTVKEKFVYKFKKNINFN